ncbi:MAG: bifunctional DNase/RNase [Vicingaceae bacterium]|jgi:bifunctional DNase/RNase
MEKIALDIVGLSYSQTQSGAYALVLGEQEGNRRLPIIIGGFEAQAIAIEMEDMTPSRPLTHDLFKSFADSFTITIEEVLIYNLIEGIFHAKLMCRQGENVVEIDTRTSDAVALAVRFKCPIYTHEFILKDAGIILDQADDSDTKEEAKTKTPAKKQKKDIASLSLNELNTQLEKALNTEDYEEASKLRDEINRRDGNQN